MLDVESDDETARHHHTREHGVHTHSVEEDERQTENVRAGRARTDVCQLFLLLTVTSLRRPTFDVALPSTVAFTLGAFSG